MSKYQANIIATKRPNKTTSDPNSYRDCNAGQDSKRNWQHNDRIRMQIVLCNIRRHHDCFSIVSIMRNAKDGDEIRDDRADKK